MPSLSKLGMALLVAILAVQFAIIISHYRHPLITDEVYYVAKAHYIVEHHRFAPVDPRSVKVEEGRAWGNSDWRPAGYPLFLAAISGGDFSDPAGSLRLRVTIVQFMLVAASLLTLYWLGINVGISGYASLVAALLLGIPPWTFAVVNEIGPDPQNLALVTFALIAFGFYVLNGNLRTLASAMTLATLTLFFRPEMIVFPPFLATAAFLLRRHKNSVPRLHIVAAALLYVSLIGVQTAYHTSVTGRLGIFGGLHIYNRGAFDWANTWFGTEKECYDFVYLIGEGRQAWPPERAFDSAAERDAVKRIVDGIAQRHLYTSADDEAFETLAKTKQREHRLRMIGIRVWHAVHLWINLENNSPLLDALATVPRTVRRPIYGALLLLRLGIIFAAGLSFVRAVRALNAGALDPLAILVLLFVGYAILRSVFIGMVLNWNVHRYVLSAWPLVLWSATVAFRPIKR